MIDLEALEERASAMVVEWDERPPPRVLEAPDVTLVSLELIRAGANPHLRVHGDELTIAGLRYVVRGWSERWKALIVEREETPINTPHYPGAFEYDEKLQRPIFPHAWLHKLGWRVVGVADQNTGDTK